MTKLFHKADQRYGNILHYSNLENRSLASASSSK